MKRLNIVINTIVILSFMLGIHGESWSILRPNQNPEFENTENDKEYTSNYDKEAEFPVQHQEIPGIKTRTKRYNKELKMHNYNSDEPPPVVNGIATPVRFNVLVFSVRGVNEILQEISVDMRLQLYWKDSRLDWKSHIPEGSKYLAISLKKMQEMWFPDIFIDYVKAVDQPKLMSPPASLRYYKNDTYFRFSTRITLRMHCPMEFRYYPADLQTCKIDMKSYAFPDDIVQLDWKIDKGPPLMLLKQGLDAPNFALSLDKYDNITIKTISGQSYTGIQIRVQLQRQLKYHMIQTYIPSSLFVFVSILSFLVPPESVPGRMTICMTTILTLTAMWSAVRSNIPKVSYIKALDIWMVACVFFVCLALIQYTVILNLRNRKSKSKDDTGDAPTSTICSPITETGFYKTVEGLFHRKTTRKSHDAHLNTPTVRTEEESSQPDKYEKTVEFLEANTWIFVAVLFIIFNCIYWPWLLVKSEYFVSLNDTVYYDEKK